MKMTLAIRFTSLIGALAFSSLGHAAPNAALGADERCLAMARYGFEVANSKSLGITEQRMKELSKSSAAELDDPKLRADLHRTQSNVISYVFTVDLKPDSARKEIFTKCKNGDFYGIK